MTEADAGAADPPLTVAIDGPAASGKGTLAKRLAVVLGVPHLDTGLLYRAVGRRVLDAGGDPADAEAATAAAVALVTSDLQRGDLRGPVADAASAAVASVSGVRAALLDFQRRFAAEGAVLDGRDIGTIVLPQARVKLFVTAGLDIRAERRHRELAARGGGGAGYCRGAGGDGGAGRGGPDARGGALAAGRGRGGAGYECADGRPGPGAGGGDHPLEAGRVADRIMSHVLPPDDLPGFPDARRTRPKTPRPGGGLSWRTRRRSASPASSAPESTPTASNGASNPCRSRGRRDATSLRINDLPSSCADLIRASTHWSKPGGRLHAAPGRLQASLDRRTGQHPSVTFPAFA